MLTDFLNWPILHLVSVVNTSLLIWLHQRASRVEHELAYMQGTMALKADKPHG